MIYEQCAEENTLNVISVSGGKDSLAMWLLAKEYNLNTVVVFADTGNEHPLTYQYIEYLEHKLGKINRVQANFAEQIKHKCEYVQKNWPADLAEKALTVLKTTGTPFLDMCLWKGRFPSTKARFCTFELKHKPIEKFVLEQLNTYDEVISWQGVRAEESPACAKLPDFEEDVNNTPGLSIYRPILKYTASDVFALAKKHGIKPNPLYTMGCSRVGCMPCINCRKSELKEIFSRFPEEINRIALWEHLVSQASKRGVSTFFSVNKDPVKKNNLSDSIIESGNYGITSLKDWALSEKGGRQFPIFPYLPDFTTCNSINAGVCE